MMNLGTFGAVVSYGIELEKQALEFYNQISEQSGMPVYSKLASQGRKRVKRLERTRRELVAEMILESISGLDSDNYVVDFEQFSIPVTSKEKAITMEKTLLMFYTDAAEKIPIREAARVFSRMASQSEQNLEELRQL
jgi:hypothetical protein